MAAGDSVSRLPRTRIAARLSARLGGRRQRPPHRGIGIAAIDITAPCPSSSAGRRVSDVMSELADRRQGQKAPMGVTASAAAPGRFDRGPRRGGIGRVSAADLKFRRHWRKLVQELRSKRRGGISLLVPLMLRSSCRRLLRCVTNFERGSPSLATSG
jgi:hypothetical protein